MVLIYGFVKIPRRTNNVKKEEHILETTVEKVYFLYKWSGTSLVKEISS